MTSEFEGLSDLAQQQSFYSTSVNMPTNEETIPVRTTDLKHLKRDIREIPDGQGKFDNAFWCALGVGIPMVIQFFLDWSQGVGKWLCLFIGLASCVMACIFKLFGEDAKTNREESIQRIIENIDDFSDGIG